MNIETLNLSIDQGSHIVTVIYSWSLPNYLREGKNEGFEVDQKAALAAPLMPGAAFLALACLALLAALISLGYEFEVLGLV